MSTEEDELALIQTKVGTSKPKSNTNSVADKKSLTVRRRNVIDTSDSSLNVVENGVDQSNRIYEMAMDTEKAWIDDALPEMPEILDLNSPGNKKFY